MTQTHRDLHGHPLSGADSRAAEHFEAACALLRCFRGNPMEPAQAAAAQAPGMVMAPVLESYLCVLGTEPGARPAAQAAHARAAALAAAGPITEREALHVAAAGALAHGRWQQGGLLLEDLSARHPHDLLALQVGHQVDFFSGHGRMLRDRIARAESHWHDGMPGHHAVLSMLAFGLEENADYAAAERLGRRAVELQPQDAWGWHAVAHVLEMQNRRAEGVRWLTQDSAAWSEGSFFAMHNWWHLAMFHLGLDQGEAVMQLLDERVLGSRSPLVLEMIDASALLWRLRLRGVPVGERWLALAERWKAVSAESCYAFNDVHAMMAFVGAGRLDDAAGLLAAQQRALAQDDDNHGFVRDVGAPLARALLDFGQGRYDAATDGLRRVRPLAQRAGGSHAQRDLIDLTLIEAATLAGRGALADALRRERAFVRH